MRLLKYIYGLGLVILVLSCTDNSSIVKSHEPDTSSNKNQEKMIVSDEGIRYDYLLGPAVYKVDGRKWNHYNLTYKFQSGTSDIINEKERQAIKEAMALWAEATDLTFSAMGKHANADIRILFGAYGHGDKIPFDGQNGVLAHTFYPPPNHGAYAGDVHFDDSESWTISKRTTSGQPIDLVTVAAHELGHALGLGHSSDEDALMYAYYYGSHRYLSQDDINGIQSLYGEPTDYPLSAYISGPTKVASGDKVTWWGSYSHAEGPVNYQWYFRTSPNGSWRKDPGATQYEYSHVFFNPGGYYKNQAIKLKVTSAGETAFDILPVEVIICHQNKLTVTPMAPPCRR